MTALLFPLLCVFVLATLIATGAAASTASRVIPSISTKKIATKKYKWELDSGSMIASSPFKIAPTQLINRCKEVVDKGIGLKQTDDLAEDFIFQFPVVGPLSKTEYLGAVGGFSLDQMFPNFEEGLYYDFRVDPYQTNRVWFTATFSAIHSGEGPFGKATGTHVVCPPQAISLTFNEQGKVTKYTGGYVMDKERGNSGGMGGIFGPLYAIGKPLPFPEARPWTPSLRYRVFNRIGAIATKLSKMRSGSKK